ncbi:uncharacterized protein LOC136072054 isoform X2 [Hydra vulgaris]|uniref:Uncharacterized protein LOC136072054 isoform X2 n=1 Tax=Hydra vulgaris TaxID=6087 RepID=A0ABM4DNQ2_HYDVU
MKLSNKMIDVEHLEVSSNSSDYSISSLSLLSIDSRTFKSFHKDKKVTELNKLEKSWFSAAAECDILKLKQYYGNDKDLLNKKDIFTGLLCIGLPRKEILICFCGFLNKKLTSI